MRRRSRRPRPAVRASMDQASRGPGSDGPPRMRSSRMVRPSLAVVTALLPTPASRASHVAAVRRAAPTVTLPVVSTASLAGQRLARSPRGRRHVDRSAPGARRPAPGCRAVSGRTGPRCRGHLVPSVRCDGQVARRVGDPEQRRGPRQEGARGRGRRQGPFRGARRGPSTRATRRTAAARIRGAPGCRPGTGRGRSARGCRPGSWRAASPGSGDRPTAARRGRGLPPWSRRRGQWVDGRRCHLCDHAHDQAQTEQGGPRDADPHGGGVASSVDVITGRRYTACSKPDPCRPSADRAAGSMERLDRLLHTPLTRDPDTEGP